MSYQLQSQEILTEVGFRASIVVFSRLLAELPVAWLMASLFFTMLILMAVNSQVINVEVLVTALLDKWPVLRARRSAVVFVVCTVLFLCGIVLCFNNGWLLVNMLDMYTSCVVLLFLGLFETIIITRARHDCVENNESLKDRLLRYLFALNWKRAVEESIVKNMQFPSIFWTCITKWYYILSWTFVCPLALLWFSISGIWHYAIYYQRTSYELYPEAVYWLGRCTPFILVLVIPLAIFLCRYKPICCAKKEQSAAQGTRNNRELRRRATGKHRTTPNTVVPVLTVPKALDIKMPNNSQERLAQLYADSPCQQASSPNLSSSKRSNFSGSRVEISSKQTDIYTYSPSNKSNIIHISVKRPTSDDESVRTDEDSTYSSLRTTEQPTHF